MHIINLNYCQRSNSFFLVGGSRGLPVRNHFWLLTRHQPICYIRYNIRRSQSAIGNGQSSLIPFIFCCYSNLKKHFTLRTLTGLASFKLLGEKLNFMQEISEKVFLYFRQKKSTQSLRNEDLIKWDNNLLLSTLTATHRLASCNPPSRKKK